MSDSQERNFIDKVLKPTDQEKKESKFYRKRGEAYQQYIEKQGLSEFLKRITEEKAAEENKSVEEIQKLNLKPQELTGGASEKVLKKYKVVKMPEAEIETPAPKNMSTYDTKSGDFVLRPEERNNEVSLGDSIDAAFVSGLIKIPKGIVNFGTLVYDAFQEEGVPVDQSLTFKFNRAFEQSMLGPIAQEAEEKARKTASGRVTEAIIQIFGASKLGGKPGAALVGKILKKVDGISNKIVRAIKGDKYVKTTGNKNLSKAVEKVAKLNQLSGKQKFAALVVGGGLGTGAVIMKAEDIGTFGDIKGLDFLPSTLDRRERGSAKDDALRQLLNKFKFGAELGFPIIPAAVGVSKLAKFALNKGVGAAFSDSLVHRLIDRVVLQPFRSRSGLTPELFKGKMELEGFKAAVKNKTIDFTRNIDDALKRIVQASTKAADAISNPDAISTVLADFMMLGKQTIKNIKGKPKIVFEGFDPKIVNGFVESMKKLGLNNVQSSGLINEITKFRKAQTLFLNEIAAGKNLNIGIKDLNDIMLRRFKNFTSNDYKALEPSGFFGLQGYKPTKDTIDEVAKIFQRYYRQNGKTLNAGDAEDIVKTILKGATKNPQTKTPEFVFGEASVLKDSATQVKNIGQNITAGGKFKPDKKGGLIQKESDLKAFKNLFGEYKNASQVITNTMGDLAEILGRDKYYNFLKKASDDLINSGQRGLFYKSYNEALKALTVPGGKLSKEVIRNPNGLKFKTNLDEEIYTSPLDGLFTTTDFEAAIKLGDDIITSNAAKSIGYKYLVMVPKGLTQMAKTVLGPFTHTRNFFSAAITTLHSGVMFIPPSELGKAFARGVKTVQPQLMYRATGNPRFRNIPENQGLYQYLLEKNVVNQNAIFKDIEGLLKDITSTTKGNLFDNLYNVFGKAVAKKLKGIKGVAQDLYIAEDDVWRITNFLGEEYRLTKAYQNAFKVGNIKKIPSQLQIMDEAAQIVIDTIPNYSRVSNFVQSFRALPFGNFVAFSSEIYRTVPNSAVLAIKQAQSPVFRSMGLQRLAGMIATYIAVPTITVQAMMGLYGITREKLSAMREMLPEWSKDSTILPIYKDGKYSYVDFSHGNFYDTMLNPVQSVLLGVEQQPDAPLIQGLADGTVKAASRMMRPFVDESIYAAQVINLIFRNGETKDGRRIFNEQDKLGDKITKSMKEVAFALSPGSLPQLKRLYKAVAGEKIKGVQYEIPSEIAGFFGFRGVPLDIPKTLNFKIFEFNSEIRDERKLIYSGTLTGDPVKDNDKIVEQFIFANNRRLETYNKMRRTYDAARVLGMRDKEIRQLFKDRGAESLYQDIRRNRFKPFDVSDNMEEAYEKLAKKNGIPNPYNKSVKKRVRKIVKRLNKQRLNEPLRVGEKEFSYDEKSTPKTPVKPLPETPTPTIEIKPMPKISQADGLTGTERALLSPSEQEIAKRS